MWIWITEVQPMHLGYFFRRSLQFPSRIYDRLQACLDPSTRWVIFLALPLMGQSLLRTLLFVIDRALLGHFSTEALASMQISATYVFSLLSIVGAFTLGAATVIRKAIDSNNCLLGTYVRATMVLSVCIGAVAAILSFFSIDTVCEFFPRVSFSVEEAAKDYLYCALPALPVYLAVMAMTTMMQVFSEVKNLFFIACLSMAVHIFLDVVLIFGLVGFPAMGARGAAIASVVATALQSYLLFAYMIKKNRFATISFSFSQQLRAIKRLVSSSFSSFIQRAIHYGSYIGFVMMVSLLGTEATATQQILIALSMLCFIPADGLGNAIIQFAGKNASQKLEHGTRKITYLALSFLSLAALIVLAASSYIMKLFTSDPEVIVLGSSCLEVVALIQPLTAIAVVLSDVLRAKGNVKTAALIAFFGAIVIRFSAAYYFAFVLGFGLIGIWWSIAVDWLVRCILLALFQRVPQPDCGL